MSSLRAASPRPRPSAANLLPRLRPVPSGQRGGRQTPFIGVFVTLLGLGMVGLVMLTTTLQDQSFEARRLQQEATELSYRQAALEVDADKARSPQTLAALASALGMRANPHPAYIVIPSGQIIGTPKPVTSADMSSIVVRSAEQGQTSAPTQAPQATQSNSQTQTQQG